ncbi:hypothetical protein [Shewanella donghaensis]|uniref:hypothetical protein n=1 Tax=Shewanella donghaensis TaxID=238836 RepID=UPI001D057CBD|nr:hypothetical protein [Shewanella donghaensis]
MTTSVAFYSPIAKAVIDKPQLRYLTSDSDRYNDRYNSRYNRHSGSSVRWGVGYNNYWGPSVGVGFSSGWRNPYYNRWGYGFNRGWRAPYRYDYYDRHYRRNYVQPTQQVEVVSPPKRTTTSIQYASGLTQLPENARVVQRDGQTIYQWEGQEYVFDWSTQRYMTLPNAEN